MKSNTSQIIIRKAIKDDLKAIKSLLESASLPSVDIEKHRLNFFVLENGGNIIGTIGMELYGDTALLRSLVVGKDYQNKGYGHKLYYALTSKAKIMNVINIYLLTETAEGFFSKEGFQKIARESVPPSIKQTYEYSTLCSESAVCMVKKLNEEASLIP
ncbi:MAG: arsenic resistance N-acetyltransferase ArsN2 [Ignavibacteriaceae bacterium]